MRAAKSSKRHTSAQYRALDIGGDTGDTGGDACDRRRRFQPALCSSIPDRHSAPAARFSVGLGNFDADGDLDMAYGAQASVADTVWLNNGTGIFTDSGQTLGNSSSRHVSIGDLDGDLDRQGCESRRGLGIEPAAV